MKPGFNLKSTLSFRFGLDSLTDVVTRKVCDKWPDLGLKSFSMYFSRDAKENLIETDGDLQSLACYCYGMKIATVEIKVNVYMSSMSSCSGASAPEFRCKLIEYSIVSGYKYELIKNDDFRVTTVCQKKNKLNCQWCIHSWESCGYFEIKKINLTHTCGFAVKDYDHPPLTFLKTHTLDFTRDKPDLTFGDITALYTHEYGLSISRHIAYADKKLALKELYGDVVLSYNDLLWYTEELKRRDPMNIIELEVNKESGKFERVFVAFESRLFPLAVSAVDIENDSNWYWFLDMSKKTFGYERRYTFLSDRHHGLLINILIVFPDSYHSFCFWHMENNLRTCLSKSCGMTKVLVALFKKCAYAAIHEKFEKHMAEFKEIGGDALSNFLNWVPYEYWANTYFCGAQYGEMCSSLAECFNSWIDKERHLPITAMFDGIRMKMMKMASAWRMECKN
ncbi:hypothetical protein IFM89_021926 [Coptis chinensis]|uniref:MULE transposase domain-containing protein n=1 Tax=Coptis chinensis TaxID=261450 RepID=A0A835HDG5_9MAGN|nr:hypothetical protein IFM89_021926 [Coptis chinensis]